MKKNIFISGNFNIIHPGHVRLFRFAKSLGGKLIIGIYSDKIAKNLSLVNETLRLENIQNNSLIDKVILIKDSLETELLKLKPDYVVKGKEYENEINPESQIISKYGGKIIFAPGDIIFSSSELIKNDLILNQRSVSIEENSYLERHKITKKVCLDIISKIKKLKVIVIGDCILDEYISCEALGMSQEDPTIAVRPVDKEIFIGGSAIVAAHCKSLGAKSKLISVVGKDDYQKIFEDKLSKINLDRKLFRDLSRPTTLKQRYRSNNKTLLRVNTLQQNSISKEIQKNIYNEVKRNIKKTDLLIFSDFNYGCLPENLIHKITDLAKKYKIKVVADSQSSSQIGDITRFKNMDFITPTEREARISIGNNEDGVVELSRKLHKASKCKNIMLKLGKEGLLVFSYKGKKILTDRISAMNQNPIDVAGAGDAMLVVSSLASATGATIWESAYLGAIASSIQVNRIGNIPLSLEELRSQI